MLEQPPELSEEEIAAKQSMDIPYNVIQQHRGLRIFLWIIPSIIVPLLYLLILKLADEIRPMYMIFHSTAIPICLALCGYIGYLDYKIACRIHISLDGIERRSANDHIVRFFFWQLIIMPAIIGTIAFGACLYMLNS